MSVYEGTYALLAHLHYYKNIRTNTQHPTRSLITFCYVYSHKMCVPQDMRAALHEAMMISTVATQLLMMTVQTITSNFTYFVSVI